MSTLPRLAAALFMAALLGCSRESSEGEPAGRAILGEADSRVAGVKVVLLEAKREGSGALLLRWEYRNETGDKVEVAPLSTAGMNAFRLSQGVEVRDPAGNRYALLQEGGSPQAAKHEDFTFAAQFKPRQVVETWAKVKAPPASVARIEVRLPTAAPIHDVRLGETGH